MFTSAKIADLQGKVSSLEAQLATSHAELTDLRASFEAQGETLTAANEKATADAARIAELEGSEATFNERVSAEVTAQLAALGTEPIKRDPDAKKETDGTITRAEFLKLNHAKRNQFIRDGGKLSD